MHHIMHTSFGSEYSLIVSIFHHWSVTKSNLCLAVPFQRVSLMTFAIFNILKYI